MIWYKYLYLGETAKKHRFFDSTETPPREVTAGRFT